MKVRFSRYLGTLIGLTTIGMLALVSPVRGADFSYDFNTDGVLPSAQGATFDGNVPETSVFSVSGGLLHQNMLTDGQYATYDMPHTFNHNFDAALTWSEQLLSSSGGPFGDAVSVFDSDPSTERFWLFGIEPDGIYLGVNDTSKNDMTKIVSMDPMDRLHTYQVVIPHDSDAFQLFVDGTLQYTGTAAVFADSNPVPGRVNWGDNTLHDQDASVDWDYIHFSNQATVPEPGALALVGALVPGAVLALRRRWRCR